MSKIGICIDPHITDRHRCRQDNFIETVLGKLNSHSFKGPQFSLA